LFFQEKVEAFFESHTEPDFARTGSVAEETVTMEVGPLPQVKKFSYFLNLSVPVPIIEGVQSKIKSGFTSLKLFREDSSFVSYNLNLVLII
jgi:hypothetical protein